MRTSSSLTLRSSFWAAIPLLALLIAPVPQAKADPATLLFEDNFTGGIPGWTAVQPSGGNYIDGPMLWIYDQVNDAFSEQSNLYTDSSTFSFSRIAGMLISDAVAPTNFAYTATLTAGDDDAFGLIWGYENANTFYRVTFARQNRALVGWPFQGFTVDRVNNGQITDLAGPDTSVVNVANVPFQVSIAVTNAVLTLSIDGNPVVPSLALPTSPSAKVGMFSWGQSGGTPRAFRIQNPTLNGTDLGTAAASQVLSNWSFTITPSSTNDYPVNNGMWAQALGANGDRGVMLENNDSAPENVFTSRTNFPVVAAIAGDSNWSNYVYSVRFISADNDGFGIFLRYQDRTNWYRIAFRNQAPTGSPATNVGIIRGLTVQKNINRQFDQMYSNGVAGFIPPINVPFEVHAAIRNERLQIIAINNPDGRPLGAGTSGGTATPTATATGPIDMDLSTIATGSLTNGKIGVFSWAQYGDNNLPNSGAPDDGTAVDWVKVRQVNGEGLLVNSTYGTPTPPTGLNDFPVSQVITASVPSIVNTSPGVRQLSTGWSGLGSVPSSGTTNEVVFTLTAFSAITWNWLVQYELVTNTTAGGTVTSTLGPWIDANAAVTVTATANPGNVFVGWSGDSIAGSAVLTFTMTRPMTLTAHFAVDSDNDGLPDSWEYQYFGAGNLSQPADGNPDLDGADNITEYRQGSNPAFAEGLVFNDGLASKWINESDDRALPGWFVVTNFGGGFRGLWENSNQNRGANSAGPGDAPMISLTSYATNASFQGPLIVVRTNVWNPSWAGTFSLSAEYSVGDDDGVNLYFRYASESNYYRITLCGAATTDPLRPLQGITIQKRTNGWFSAITPTIVSQPITLYPDPTDATGGFKRLRVTVNATNDTFEVRVIGWNVFLAIPDWDPASETVMTFTDGALSAGRMGIGPWGMAGFGAWNATAENPIGSGAFVDNISVSVSGTNAFSEDWETTRIHTDIPAGWENPYAGVAGYEGDWNVSAHGTFANFTRAFGTDQTGTLENPRADGEGPILLAPALTNASFLLELGIHPMDDGGMGFVYDFKDTNNFARVLFNSQLPLPGEFAQGLNVSRKSGGTWTDITAGDSSFIYTPGRRFEARFSNNNGVYTLSAWNTDAPANVYRWQWTDQATVASNRFGLAIWDMPDAHFTYARAYGLPQITPVIPFKISNILVVGGNVVLNITKPDGASYHVLRSISITGPYTTNAANQTGAQYSEPLPAGAAHYYRLQLLP